MYGFTTDNKTIPSEESHIYKELISSSLRQKERDGCMAAQNEETANSLNQPSTKILHAPIIRLTGIVILQLHPSDLQALRNRKLLDDFSFIRNFVFVSEAPTA